MNCSFSYAKFGCVGLNRRDFFGSNIVTFSDYYPFGMVMRNGGANYRYNFQGQESDDEVKGKGNSYTTKFRQYDSRLGMWLSIAPLGGKFPWQSPYVAFDNNPVYYNDPLGLASKGPGKKISSKRRYKVGKNRWRRGPKGKRNQSRMSLAQSLGHGLRKIKNGGQRTFGGRKSKAQTVNLGKWKSSEWEVTLNQSFSGNHTIYNHLNMPLGARLTGIKTTVDRGNQLFKNLNYVGVKGYGANGFRTRFSSPGFSTGFIPDMFSGKFFSSGTSKPFPLMNLAIKYLMTKLSLSTFGLIIPPFGTDIGQDFRRLTAALYLGNRLNPIFRKTTLLQIDIKTAGTIKIMQEIKYMHMVRRNPNWFQKVFMMNY